MEDNKNEILSELNGDNLPSNWLEAIKQSKKVMDYLGDDIEYSGSLAEACMNALDLEESKGKLVVRDSDGRKLATLKL